MTNSKWYKLVIPHTNLKIHPHTYLPLQALKNSIQISNHRNLPSYLIKHPLQLTKPLIVSRIANSRFYLSFHPLKSQKLKLSIFHITIHNQCIFPKFLPFSEVTFVVKKIQKFIPLVTPLLTLITFTSIVPFSLNSSHAQHILSWITHFHIYFHALVSLKFHYFFTIFILTSKTELQIPI